MKFSVLFSRFSLVIYFFKMRFNWRVVALQFVMVSAMHQHEPGTGVSCPLPPEPRPIPPSRYSQGWGGVSVSPRPSKLPPAVSVTCGRVCLHTALSVCPTLSLPTVSTSLCSASASHCKRTVTAVCPRTLDPERGPQRFSALQSPPDARVGGTLRP